MGSHSPSHKPHAQNPHVSRTLANMEAMDKELTTASLRLGIWKIVSKVCEDF